MGMWEKKKLCQCDVENWFEHKGFERPFAVMMILLTTTVSKNDTTWFPHLLHFSFFFCLVSFWGAFEGGEGSVGGGVGGPLFVCECIFLCSLKDCTGISAHLYFVSPLVYFWFLFFFYLFFGPMPSIYFQSGSTETWKHFQVNKRHIFFHFNYFPHVLLCPFVRVTVVFFKKKVWKV